MGQKVRIKTEKSEEEKEKKQVLRLSSDHKHLVKKDWWPSNQQYFELFRVVSMSYLY